MDEQIRYCCMPAGISPEQAGQWLMEDPAHCDALLQEMRDTAEGKYVGRNNINPDAMRAQLPQFEKNLAVMKARALYARLVTICAEECRREVADPELLARARKLAYELRDYVLDLPELDRAQITMGLTAVMDTLDKLSAPDMLAAGRATAAQNTNDQFISALSQWMAGLRTAEHRAHCLKLCDELLADAESLPTEIRESRIPMLLEFRAILSGAE